MARGPAGRDAFVEGLRRLGLDVSRETLDRLGDFVALLERWQSAINLVGRATLDQAWTRHVLDSAQLVPLIPADAHSLVDLGSGAGFPGLIVTALRPDLAVALVEADARKAAFLGEAARLLAPAKPPRIVISRIEAVSGVRADVITARAVAPLGQLLAWAAPCRTDTAICLFHKGKGWQRELTEAMKDWEIPYQSFVSVTDRDAVLLRIGPYAPAGVRHRQSEGRRRQNDHGD
jgi:16S rRNA (guanine527-N7)-methyltransferase